METLTVLFLIVFAFVDPPVGKAPPNHKSFAETSYKVLRRDCLTQPLLASSPPLAFRFWYPVYLSKLQCFE